MNNFFRNIKINVEEFFEKLKMTDKKVIITTVLTIVAIIIVAISIFLIVQERKDPVYSADKMAEGYINEYKDFNYYEAYNYTVLRKKGVDNYISDIYLKDLKGGEANSENAKKVINSVSLAYSVALFNKASQNGFNDCDSLFEWFFTDAITSVRNTDLEKYATKAVMLESFKQSVKAYKQIADEKLKEEYIGYDLKMEKSDEKNFSNEEVQLYKEAKSDKAKQTLVNAGIDLEDIKDVRRYDYVTIINSKSTKTMSVYLIKIGQKWYVDNTALI